MPELEYMAQPDLLQAALHPPLPLLPYVISSFFPSSEHGPVMRAEGVAHRVQREEVASSGVLWVWSPMSFICCLQCQLATAPLAADRSYSEPGSMGKCGGLGDSHGRRVGRRAAGREEQVGFLRRFLHLPPATHSLLSCEVSMMQMSFSFPSLQGLQSDWVLLPRCCFLI